MAYPMQRRPQYDRLKTLDIKALAEHLKEPNRLIGTLNNGENFNMSIEVNSKDNPFIELSYKADEVAYTYKIEITAVPSNLGIGKVFYFVCPITSKRCRKLYFYNNRFTHRDGIPNGIYFSQTKSRCWRALETKLGTKKGLAVFDELEKPHFTRYYNGKKTRRYKSILKKIDRMNASSLSTAEYNKVIDLACTGVPMSKLLKY